MQACELVHGSFNSSGRSSCVNAWVTVFGATRITFFYHVVHVRCTTGAWRTALQDRIGKSELPSAAQLHQLLSQTSTKSPYLGSDDRAPMTGLR
jgi:hypothetical protein